MAESKNSFIQSKMNKDLDERLIPNNVYRDALNIAVSRSEGSDVGALESVLGNSVVSTGSGHADLTIIGKLVDEANSLIYFFKTNYTGSADILPADPTVYEMSIEVYNTSTGQTSVKVQGNFLNFSTLNPIYGVNLIENLLFWTDNRNAPRKINVDNSSTYYTNADQISVCKWAPYIAPEFIDLRTIITPTNATHPSTMSDASDLPVVSISLQEVSSQNLAVTQYRNGDAITHAPNQTDWNTYNSTGVGCWAYYDNSLGNGVSYGILYNKWAVNDPRNLAPIGYEVANLNQLKTIAGIPPGTGKATELKAEGFEYWENALILLTPGTGYTAGTQATTNSGSGNGLTVTITISNGAITSGVISAAGSGYVDGDVITISGGTGGTFTWTGSIEGTNLNQFNARGAGERTNAAFIELKESTTFWAKDSDDFLRLTSDSADAIIVTAPGTTPKLAGRSVRVIRNADYNGWNGDPEYLKDKFAKFSYRFKFNDNEYSLVAPFSQDVFIPEQQGHFVNDDENEAFITTVVEFMQNSINNAVLNITLPSLNIINDYKIKAIDIIVKESDAQAYSVVETIPVNPSFITALNNTNIYQYTYQSLLPVKTLTLQQTTRVFDKVPVKALSQETSGNRVMYGNFTQGYGTPFGLNYYIDNNAKTLQNEIEYPNHSVKQNRNYQVGVILADKYGRQTDIILSNYDDQLDSEGNPIPGSNLFINYKPLSFADDVAEWPGDNIQLNFNTPGIPESSNFNLATDNYPGAYAIGNYYQVPFALITGKYFWDLSNQSITAAAGDTVFDFNALSYSDTQVAINSYELYKNENDGWIKLTKADPVQYTIADNAGEVRATLTAGATAGVVYKFRLLYTASNLNKYQTGQYATGGDSLIPDFATTYSTYFAINKEFRGLYCDYTAIKTVTPLHTPIRAVDIYTTQEVATKYLFNNTTVTTRPEPVLTAVTTPVTFATYDINPKGFYSYKLGIKQQQQDYYNVYLPGIINGYPIDGNLLERNEIAFTTLIADNINKIPRNLQDVGPLQNQFTSDERMWGRVTNVNQVVNGIYKTYNKQFLPSSSPDSADLVGTIKDIYPTTDTEFSIPPAAPTNGQINSFSIYDPETRPYVAKFSTQQGIGLTENNFVIPSGATNQPYPGGMSLAVYETVPTTVPFELFYETSTTGLISDLNDLIQGENTAINGMTTPTVSFNESDTVGTTITTDIYPTINGAIYTGARGTLKEIYNYNLDGSVNDTINFALDPDKRFDEGSNTGSTSIFIRTGGTNPAAGGTFYAGSSSETSPLFDVQFAGKFLYTIEWSDNNVLTRQSGTFQLANSTPVIFSAPIIPSLTTASQWIFGNTGTIADSRTSNPPGGGVSPSGRNGSARNTNFQNYGNHGEFNLGSGSNNQCWSMTELRITDTSNNTSTYTDTTISNFFTIGQSALSGSTGDADRDCRFNLQVNSNNPLAAGYEYCIDFRLTDTIGDSISTTVCFGPPANSYTSVESTSYTSGTDAGTQASTLLIGGGIIPEPSWSGQIQNWRNEIIYLYVRFKVDSATDQLFIVDVNNDTNTRGYYPNGTSAGSSAAVQFPIQSGAFEGFGAVGGQSLTAFGASSNAIANGVRPGMISTVNPGTYGPYDYNTASLVNIKYAITQDPYIVTAGHSWEAELMWSANSNPTSISQLNSMSQRTGSVPPFYSNILDGTSGSQISPTATPISAGPS